MLQSLRQLFTRRSEPGPPRFIPEGQRVYAVGDVHGRLDLFDALLSAIAADDAATGHAATTLVLLGDLVDRGDESAGVVERARQLQARCDTRILAGNHEEMFLRSFDDIEMFRHFIRHGGRETIFSYGVDEQAFAEATMEEAQELMRAAVPQADLDFIESFEDMVVIGDYLFVHAGIDPRVPLSEQKQHSLRWIREPFLSHSEPHELMVVHGHTICDAPEDCGNRIGIDTGAFMSGRLTAVRLEGDTRRFIEAVESEEGDITTTPVPA